MHSAQIKPNPEIITQGKCHLCGKLDLLKHLHAKTKDANDILNSIYAACSDIMKQIIYFQFSFGYQLFLLEELTVQNISNTLKSKLQVSLKTFTRNQYAFTKNGVGASLPKTTTCPQNKPTHGSLIFISTCSTKTV